MTPAARHMRLFRPRPPRTFVPCPFLPSSAGWPGSATRKLPGRRHRRYWMTSGVFLTSKPTARGVLTSPPSASGHHDRLYVDRCDEEWRAIEITAQGWGLIHRPPVKFSSLRVRPGLPEPVCGDMVDACDDTSTSSSEDDFRLIIFWLAAAVRPGFSFPILIINGIHGSGKSMLCKMLPQLIDSDVALVYSPPTNERDLILAATNTWVISFDNVSEI